MNKYTPAFYSLYEEGSYLSAKQILPIAFALINPKSVIDIGCGVGTWLRACIDLDCKEILGVDGDYVDRYKLKIPVEKFHPHDLTTTLNLGRKFDLVISVEVAEHLPMKVADLFVQNLINLGDAILFSAAQPGQGGVDHVNEQYPEYWMELFKKHDYFFYDIIRPQIFDLRLVELWYRQNLFFVCTKKIAESLHLEYPGLSKMDVLVYKKFDFYKKAFEGELGVSNAIKILGRAIKKSVRRRAFKN